MRSYDLTPLLRSTIGFDHLSRLLDAAVRTDDSAISYPPYNIEKLGENDYRLTMAVAGFDESDIAVTVTENTLEIAGKAGREGENARRYLHRGIATRTFRRRFDLADHIQVVGAALENGLLHVELRREIPEAMKPRAIKIETAAAAKALDDSGSTEKAA